MYLFMADEEQVDGQEGEGKPKKGKGLLIIIVVVLLLVVGGGGAAFMMMGGGEEEISEDDIFVEEKLEARKLEPFVVNLKGGRSFLKLTLMIEYDLGLLGFSGLDEDGEIIPRGDELPGALGERKPMIRDAILTVLSSKSATHLLTVDGKGQLKEELVEAINDAVDLDEAPVTGVYFLEFLVQ